MTAMRTPLGVPLADRIQYFVQEKGSRVQTTTNFPSVVGTQFDWDSTCFDFEECLWEGVCATDLVAVGMVQLVTIGKV